MARPTKKGLDYFPLDCDFFSDEKVISVKVNYGAKGVAVMVALLCAIYRQGYFAELGEALHVKIANETGVSVELVPKVIDSLVKVGFFDRRLYEDSRVLTSRAIQRRFFDASKRRKMYTETPFLLLNVDNNPINACNNSVSVCNNATKESKVKEKKEKKPSTVVDVKKPTPTAESDEDFQRILQADTPWLESVARRHGLSVETLSRRLADFPDVCMARGKTAHDSLDDYRCHFDSWLSKAPPSSPTTSSVDARREQQRIDREQREKHERENPPLVGSDIHRRLRIPQGYSLAQWSAMTESQRDRAREEAGIDTIPPPPPDP